MNIKITQEIHDYLYKNSKWQSYTFGSQLHGIATENSDLDLIYIYELKDSFNTIAKYYPNIHSLQYDAKEINVQAVWMTTEQFYQNLFSGDGNMCADIVILNSNFKANALYYCYTYKVIKGYLGVAKRDLKLHAQDPKKRFHAARSLMFAEYLMQQKLPTKHDIQNLYKKELKDKEYYWEKEAMLRDELNVLLYLAQINMYPAVTELNPVHQLIAEANNIREFKY